MEVQLIPKSVGASPSSSPRHTQEQRDDSTKAESFGQRWKEILESSSADNAFRIVISDDHTIMTLHRSDDLQWYMMASR